MNVVLSVAFVVAAVAFFKERFGLFGWQALLSAFGVCLVVAFLPDLEALLPQYSAAIDKIVLIVTLFISAPGIFDLAVDVGKKVQQ